MVADRRVMPSAVLPVNEIEMRGQTGDNGARIVIILSSWRAIIKARMRREIRAVLREMAASEIIFLLHNMYILWL